MILGRPIFRAWVITTEAGATLLGSNMKLYEGVDWSLADVDSICIGLLVQLVGLSTFDSGPEASAVLNFAAEQRRRFAAPAANLRGFLARTALFLVHKMAQVFFLVLIHANYLTRLENKIVGSSVMSERDGILHFSFTWPGFIVHSLMGIFTIIPIFATVTSGMPETGNYKSWAKKVELAKLVSSMTIIVAHMVYQKAYGASGPEQEMYRESCDPWHDCFN
ncbi:hypothetical protein JCM33374_g4942 [Metschnikowia sp. JCM 33374]|nr:hypothetical protein JCM33374_g4942 [Metschnikowia sp. JCM 33374]